MSDSITLIKLQILRTVAEEEGIRSPQLQERVFLSEAQLRRYTRELRQAGLLEAEPESSSARAAFIFRLGPNASKQMCLIAYDSLSRVDRGMRDMKQVLVSFEGLIMQLERHINQMLEDLR